MSIEIPGDRGLQASNDFATLVTKTGAVLENGDLATTRKLDALLRSRGVATLANSESYDGAPPIAPSSDDVDSNGVTHMALYSVRLKEWSTQKGKGLSFKDSQITLDPPKFQVRALVEDMEFFGTARSKKHAQHVAAKRACENLDIEVR